MRRPPPAADALIRDRARLIVVPLVRAARRELRGEAVRVRVEERARVQPPRTGPACPAARCGPPLDLLRSDRGDVASRDPFVGVPTSRTTTTTVAGSAAPNLSVTVTRHRWSSPPPRRFVASSTIVCHSALRLAPLASNSEKRCTSRRPAWRRRRPCAAQGVEAVVSSAVVAQMTRPARKHLAVVGVAPDSTTRFSCAASPSTTLTPWPTVARVALARWR